jgi:hypothetical protein
MFCKQQRRTDMLSGVVEAFHRAARLSREDVFGDPETLLPRNAQDDAQTAAPGWVGPRWQSGGTLLVAINPGGGGDGYRRNPTDDRLYGLIRAFRDASTQRAQAAALADLSAAWIEIQRTHNIWTVIKEILHAVGAAPEETAFLNVVPFRTRRDVTPRLVEQQRAWRAATLQQARALAPGRIVDLGQKAYDALTRLEAASEFDVFKVRRTIGDSYIHPEARLALERLAASVGGTSATSRA